MFRFWRNWRAHRITEKELMRLSDRELHDIGISRCDIRRIARQTF
jgi:uncharacterized protein YjiS (DUF1127 family)